MSIKDLLAEEVRYNHPEMVHRNRLMNHLPQKQQYSQNQVSSESSISLHLSLSETPQNKIPKLCSNTANSNINTKLIMSTLNA